MKLAYPVATFETVARTLAWSANLATIAPQLHAMGYAGVELFVRDPRQLNADEIRATLTRHDLIVAAVGTGPVVADDGLTFTDRDPSIREAAVQRACNVIDFAARLGAQTNIGKLRGNIGHDAQAVAWRDEAFRRVCAHAAKRGAEVTIEPQHRGIIDNLNRTQESLEWLGHIQLPNLHLLLDSHHLHAEEPSIPAALAVARPQLLHVHLADVHRLCPGRGSIDFAGFLRILRALGYDRYLTVEIDQAPDSASAAADAVDYLNCLLRRL